LSLQNAVPAVTIVLVIAAHLCSVFSGKVHLRFVCTVHIKNQSKMAATCSMTDTLAYFPLNGVVISCAFYCTALLGIVKLRHQRM